MDVEKIISQLPSKARYDYFLIWGHGIKYEEKIINLIREFPNLDIVMVNYHKPESMTKLIKAIYSHDYAPLEHLRDKTRYLEQVPQQAIFIFAINTNPVEEYIGEGQFRHVECLRIKQLKEEIRNRFNPRANGKRTEFHIIHASDNEVQTHHALRYLGYSQGMNYFLAKPNPILNLPAHLAKFNSFRLQQVELDHVRCTILSKGKKPGSFERQIIPIEQAPHFKALQSNRAHYDKYRQEYKQFVTVIDDHFWAKFKTLRQMKYLGVDNPTDYILLEEIGSEQYIIRDGVHRASILKHKGINSFIAAIINETNS